MFDNYTTCRSSNYALVGVKLGYVRNIPDISSLRLLESPCLRRLRLTVLSPAAVVPSRDEGIAFPLIEDLDFEIDQRLFMLPAATRLLQQWAAWLDLSTLRRLRVKCFRSLLPKFPQANVLEQLVICEPDDPTATGCHGLWGMLASLPCLREVVISCSRGDAMLAIVDQGLPNPLPCLFIFQVVSNDWAFRRDMWRHVANRLNGHGDDRHRIELHFFAQLLSSRDRNFLKALPFKSLPIYHIDSCCFL
ncbi:hypothetical protein DL96DRAFT_147365 [Flagelloscypha sp. PMI_526]|nr:hypothetical protein DL96DRAFT_147365 [Flagelloscypha sp. PMI_526]